MSLFASFFDSSSTAVRRLVAGTNLAVAIACFGGAATASAVPIDLGTTTGQPASASEAMNRLNAQIALYNAANGMDLESAVLAGAEKTEVPGGSTSFLIDVTGWSYLVLKFGPLNQHFYVGDDTGEQSFTTRFGLSNYVFFNPLGEPPASVPDAGNTVLLTGLAFLALAAFRRFSRR